MNDRPTTKTVPCPQCGSDVTRDIIWIGDKEFQSERGCICDACDSARQSTIDAADTVALHAALWRKRVPHDYHRARAANVRPSLLPALAWKPRHDRQRLGLCGPAGCGKSMAAALVAQLLCLPFRWINGFAARSLYNAAVSGDDAEKRRESAAAWLKVQRAPLLVLDDVDKGNFTEAWASALFDLLEQRNNSSLPTVWTANHGPGALAKKFSKCGDAELADAIERRLCGGACIYTASTSENDAR